MKTAVGYLPIVIVALAIWASMWLGLIPPEQKTESDIQVLFRRIENYAATCGHPPSALAELDGQSDSKYCDAWGVPFEYIPQPDSSIVLTSLGKPGENNIRVLRFSMVDRTDSSGWKAASDTIIYLLDTDVNIKSAIMWWRTIDYPLI